jgi:hypothetical protein
MEIFWIILLLLGAAVVIALLLKGSKNDGIENWKELIDKISLWCEVAYQEGYSNFKEGKPQRSWEVDTTAKKEKSGDSEKIILSCLKNAYQRGRQDAAANLPSVSKQIWKLRDELLERYRNTISEMRKMAKD